MCLYLGSIRAAVDSERFSPLLLLPPAFVLQNKTLKTVRSTRSFLETSFFSTFFPTTRERSLTLIFNIIYHHRHPRESFQHDLSSY